MNNGIFAWKLLQNVTVIWISRLQMAKSCSLFTYIRFKAYLLELGFPVFTRNTIANPPTKKILI